MEIDSSTPIQLKQHINAELIEPIQNIRTAISILFSFIRGPMPDKVRTL